MMAPLICEKTTAPVNYRVIMYKYPARDRGMSCAELLTNWYYEK